MSNELHLVTCKQCGATVDGGGLCSYRCKFDGVLEKGRPPETLEVRVYILQRTETYQSV